mmetsp:Transcript_55256/g.108094  ORF Transcript_55256/g.108094 Transcript_55256/m.108094 type:complete len:123 (-) Transcript_55256:28-396(-)
MGRQERVCLQSPPHFIFIRGQEQTCTLTDDTQENTSQAEQKMIRSLPFPCDASLRSNCLYNSWGLRVSIPSSILYADLPTHLQCILTEFDGRLDISIPLGCPCSVKQRLKESRTDTNCLFQQ